MKYHTPDLIESPFGELQLVDGVPTSESSQRIRDHALHLHGVDVFLSAFRQASVHRLIEGTRQFGVPDGDVLIFSELMDSTSLFLTANTDTVYFWSVLDLSNGPIVVDVPPNTIFLFNDSRFEWVGDGGNPGPDRGEGGRYLIVGPDYDGPLPEGGYFVYSSAMPTVLAVGRAFLENDDPAPAVARIKEHLRISPYVPGGYGFSVSQFVSGNGPLAPVPEGRIPQYFEGSHQPIDTLVPESFEFFELCNDIVQSEPVGIFNLEIGGMLRAIGIRKGEPFEPSAHEREILTNAALVASAIARDVSFVPAPDLKFEYYDDSPTWTNLLFQSGFDMTRPPATLDSDGVHMAEPTGAINLASRTGMFYLATLITPAMAMRMPGVGSQYLLGFLDSDSEPLSGDRAYELMLPAGIPAQAFWSVIAYDNQTRSMLITDQRYPRAGSQNYPTPAATPEADGSVVLTLSGQRPANIDDGNWIQTVPGRGFFLIVRFYSPAPSFFDKSWHMGDITKRVDGTS